MFAKTKQHLKDNKKTYIASGITAAVTAGIVMFVTMSRANVALLTENGELVKDLEFLLDDYNDLFDYCLSEELIQEAVKLEKV